MLPNANRSRLQESRVRGIEKARSTQKKKTYKSVWKLGRGSKGRETEEIEPISHAEKRDFQVKRSDNRI